MNIGDIFTVEIEKMINGGNAIARIDNFPIFIENACPEDKIKIKITKLNKAYAIADIVEIISESKYRIKPFCAFSKICGSCDWQHIDYNEQLNQKSKIVNETLKNIAGIEIEVPKTIASPQITEYRCKVQYPVSQTKVSKRLVSGYYKKNSHELINIKYCPIQPKIINEINEFIKEEASNLGISGYIEKKHTGLLRHIVYRISSDRSNILIIFVVNSNNIDKNLIKLAESLSNKFKEVTGICANFNEKKTNVILGKETQRIIGNDYYIERLRGIEYKVSANSFFQVNPLSAANIFDKLKELIKENIENPTILDAYSGVSSIGIWMNDIAKTVTCVEEVKSASKDALDNIQLNNLSNFEIINDDADKVFKKFILENRKFDVTIIDPPRKGSSEKALENLINLTSKYLLYVSCNPSTLARDLKYLLSNGFKINYIQPFDMFPHTYHIETVVLLEQTNINSI